MMCKPMFQPCWVKVMVPCRVQRLEVCVSCALLLNPLKAVRENFVKRPHRDNLQNLCFNRADTRSSLQAEFKGWSHVSPVRSITSKALEGIWWKFGQMLTSSSRFAEPTFQPCWFKVIVTRSKVWALHCIPCLLHYFFPFIVWGRVFAQALKSKFSLESAHFFVLP